MQCEPDGQCCTAGAAAWEGAQGCSRLQSEDKREAGGAKPGVVSFTLLIGKVSGLKYFQNCGQVLLQREQIRSLQNRARE